VSGASTAWHDGAFREDVPGVVGRSDVVLGQPNTAPAQAMPLGNGSLGAGVWAANGFTAQLNRADTLPDRLSPGQLVIPGLAALTGAADYRGRLDLYDGVLTESGGGMTATAYVRADTDELVVDVTGADPASTQSVQLHLWQPRTPTTQVIGSVGALSQTWVDNIQPGGGGQTFGALAAATVGGRDVTASVVDPVTVQLSFRPNRNGSYQVVVAAPQWTGGDTATVAAKVARDAAQRAAVLQGSSARWWHGYWHEVGLMELSSADGTAQYLENLRTLYLYLEAGIMHSGQYPGSQAGVADLYAYDQDQQDWYPAGYWLWNLRGQIAANLSSGNFALNTPIFDLYLNDLPAIESWTSAQMGGKPGACVPETMRFNGNGYYNGGSASNGASCATASSPTYNAETITSGAEIALWIWQQYQDTGSISFLQKYYPVLQQAATFLLAWQSVGSDGYLHAVANAHETQWAVQDPTTDIAADQALFSATVSAATLLGTDSALVGKLRTALGQIEPFARTDASTHSQLLTASSDAAGADVIGTSYQPTAATHNVENVGLEPVWPYGVIGDNTVVSGDNLTALADRTYNSRQYVANQDWSYDAVQAARLDLASQVQSDLVAETEKYQVYISGLSAWRPSAPDEPYIEQSSNVATAINEALATDYDGTLRFAPAWPSGWDVSGTVYIQGGSKVDVQVEGGTLATAAIQAGSTQTLSVRNPWSGQQAEVVNGSTGAVVVAATTAATLSVPVTAGQTYLVERPTALTTSLPFAQVTGTAATTSKQLGSMTIGLSGNSASSGNTVTVTAPGNQSAAVGTAISSLQALATDSASGQSLTYTAAGLPPGLSISSAGLISGTPTTAGSYAVTVTATDSTGAAGTAAFTWTVTGGTTAGGGTCQVSYVKNEWTGGLTANLTVTNTGTATINGWTLTFSVPGDQKITSSWNATVTQSGAAVTATNATYNATIAPGGNAQFGFQGTWTSNDTSPTAFSLNGTVCSVG
jgi:hypothetical protein